MLVVAETRVAEQTDADLVRRIAGAPPGQAREEEGELYRRLAPRVRLYGLRHLRDEQAAADLTQQVLWTTIAGLREGRVREPDKLASFVLGACRLVVLDIRRGAARRDRLLQQFEAGLELHWSPEPNLDLDRLRRCLESLTERERSVVVMTYYADHASAEVADHLGLSEGNVRIIRHRALGRLRDCMTGAGRTS